MSIRPADYICQVYILALHWYYLLLYISNILKSKTFPWLNMFKNGCLYLLSLKQGLHAYRGICGNYDRFECNIHEEVSVIAM